jgi:2-polyprenyl-6-hydroxyphenyl methylase/3-demethylubiquinone-9 3-methyltransferase
MRDDAAVSLLPRPANDPLQYDDLATEWWAPRGGFAALHWVAAARARLVPPASSTDAILLDLACGGGLLAPHLSGYRHLGVDLGEQATQIAREHGVTVVRGNVLALPFRDACADVVVAGEILEHVEDLEGVVAEACRVLKPGGTLVCDTLADTWLCRFVMVTLAERVGVIPRGIHDGSLFVDPQHLKAICHEHGVELALNGLRPRVLDGLGWVAHVRADVRMVSTRSTQMVFQGKGVKR